MEITLLVVLSALVILAFIFRKEPWLEKYWKYFLILLPVIALLLLEVLKKKPAPGSTGTGQSVNDPNSFAGKIQEVKDSLQEANTVAQVKTEIIKQQEDKKVAELNTILQQPDASIRRKQLADLLNNMKS